MPQLFNKPIKTQLIMTQEQQNILDTIPESSIIYYLREVKHKAFILWGTDDVIDKAKELGFDMSEDDAINIVKDLDRHKDCSYGITWDNLDTEIGAWVDKNSYQLLVDAEGHEMEVTMCSLNTNDNIEEYWKDDKISFYGLSKSDAKKHIGEIHSDTGYKILKVI